jgi:hypothetical protein
VRRVLTRPRWPQRSHSRDSDRTPPIRSRTAPLICALLHVVVFGINHNAFGSFRIDHRSLPNGQVGLPRNRTFLGVGAAGAAGCWWRDLGSERAGPLQTEQEAADSSAVNVSTNLGPHGRGGHHRMFQEHGPTGPQRTLVLRVLQAGQSVQPG